MKLLEKIGMVGENKKERQTHHHFLIHETHEQGMVAAGSNSPHQPREGKLCHQQTNNLIDNAPVRIIGNEGEKQKIKGKLTVTAFSWNIVSG